MALSLRAQVPQQVIPLTASVQATPPRITLHWPQQADAPFIHVYRQSLGEGTWHPVAQLAGTSTSYSDLDVAEGDAWDYLVTSTDLFPIVATACAVPGTFVTFNIYDVSEDGLCCIYADGSWRIEGCGGLVASGATYGAQDQAYFQVCGAGACTPLTITVTPDEFAPDIFWELVDDAGGTLASGGNYTDRRFGRLYAGIEAPAEDQPGSILVLVAEPLALPLGLELDRLREDLFLEGWNAIVTTVPNGSSVPGVKALVTSTAATTPDLKALLLVGHLPVPYSGVLAPDGHIPDHLGAWPADLFYADLDGSWTDNTVDITDIALPVRNQNEPGDGKYDQSALPSDVDLMLGRIDLSSLPAFAQSEVELTRAYLDRDHAFRTAQLTFEQRALVDENFPEYDHESAIYRSCTPMFGPANVMPGDLLTELGSGSWMWAVGAGPGSPTSASGVGTTAQLAATPLHGAFGHLFGSYFGDWDFPDNFLRAGVAAGFLGTVWGQQELMFHHMALGLPIGDAVRRSQNASYGTNARRGRLVNIDLMGDPTLTMYPVAPVPAVSADSVGGGVQVAWDAAPAAALGYHVYRRPAGAGPFQRITDVPVPGLGHFDAAPLVGEAEYLVRPLDLITTASGSFQRLGRGAIADVSFHVGIADLDGNTALQVFPVPAPGSFTVRPLTNAPIRSVELLDASGRALPLTVSPGTAGEGMVTTPARTGHYQLRVTTTEGVYRRGIVIVQ